MSAGRDRAMTSPKLITVRLLTGSDRVALKRLAGVDSTRAPECDELLGAEVDGRLVAAVSLLDAGVIADPFQPTAAAVELLRLRARQLRGETPRPRRRRLRLSAMRRRPAPASLAGSPPGAGGRLLRL